MKKLKVIDKKVAVASTSRTLRDAIDITKLFTMIYSGVESEKYFSALYDLGIRDFLMSYHYVRSKNLGDRNFKDLGVKLFIDSGAYTYQNDPQYGEYTVKQWETQIVEYLEWSKKNKDIIFAIANLDLENLVGTEQVNEWNRKYFEPFMIETGIPVCFIWHPVSGEKYWDKMCERYPYTGFSWVADDGVDFDFNYGKRLIQVAQKYNTVCHGMGMTRTSLLPKLPFYTVDSTTWMVGLQYGELNYWNGKKMSRLKKDKWNEYKPKLVRLGVDFDKLKAEETSELIRANVLAFIEAEKYIRDRLKSRMYWLKPVAVFNNIEDPNIFNVFPSIEWVKGESDDEGWEEYAKTLNINPSEKTTAVNAIIDCTVFCNWDNPDFAEFINLAYTSNDGMITKLHDVYVNQVCGSDEERIQELKDFFWGAVQGTNDKLLTLGTSFAKAQERDKYIEEDNFDLEDVDEEEIKSRLSEFLPSIEDSPDPAPEITELDDEIFKKVDIVAVRDDSGKFLKGQTKVRKPKQIYSDKYPKLACDTCYAAQTCPEVKPGYVCAFNKMFKRFDTRDMGDIVEAMQGMVGMNLQRMQRVAIFEMLDGGMPDGNLTGMIDQNMRLLQTLKQLYDNGSPEILRHTKVVRADGSREESTSISNPQGGGLLEKLFMQSAREKDDSEENIEAEYEVEE